MSPLGGYFVFKHPWFRLSSKSHLILHRTCLLKIRRSLKESLVKSAMIYRIHDNLNGFLEGFFDHNRDRDDTLRAQHLRRWLDSIMFEALMHKPQAHYEDHATLVKIILERSEDDFGQM